MNFEFCFNFSYRGNNKGNTTSGDDSYFKIPELFPFPRADRTKSNVEACKDEKSAESFSIWRSKPSTKEESEDEEKPAKVKTSNAGPSTSGYMKESFKRKMKLKTSFTQTYSVPHPHEIPVTNCYQVFLDIRKQVSGLILIVSLYSVTLLLGGINQS